MLRANTLYITNDNVEHFQYIIFQELSANQFGLVLYNGEKKKEYVCVDATMPSSIYAIQPVVLNTHEDSINPEHSQIVFDTFYAIHTSKVPTDGVFLYCISDSDKYVEILYKHKGFYGVNLTCLQPSSARQYTYISVPYDTDIEVKIAENPLCETTVRVSGRITQEGMLWLRYC